MDMVAANVDKCTFILLLTLLITFPFFGLLQMKRCHREMSE